MQKGNIAIILVNWNNTNDTLHCIKQLQQQSYKNFEIVVVDNNSPDHGGELIQKRFTHHITFIQTKKNIGYAGGNNKGLEYAIKKKIEYILFLNSDVELDSHMLQYLVDAAQETPSIGAFSPIIYYGSDKKKIWFIKGNINWWKGTTPSQDQRRQDQGNHHQYILTDRIPGTAFFTYTAILKKTGGFDPIYFMYMEDVDLSYKIHRLGYDIGVIPKAKLWHYESSTSGGSDSPNIIYYYTRNKLLFMKKYATKLQFITSFCYEIYFCIRRVGGHIIKRKLSIHDMRAMIFAIWDFFTNKTGKVAHTL